MTTAWTVFVSVLVIGNLLGLMWLLFSNASNTKDDDHDDSHEWDGLKELNYPLPRWWFNLFVITTIFAGVYMVLYPTLGGIEGVYGWTQLKQLEERLEVKRASKESIFSQYENATIQELQLDSEAMQSAHRMFANTCAACHGADGRGGTGFPDLTDNDWLYGGAQEAIQASIMQGRTGMMPAFGQFLSNDDITSLSNYVLSLSKPSTNEEETAENAHGKTLFAQQCAACHNADGSGNQVLGAANLKDDIWLHGSDSSSVQEIIQLGKTNRMPPHKQMLSKQQGRLLAAYVLSLNQSSRAQ